MSDFRVLITGGGGFLGRAMVQELKNRHPLWKIDALDIKAPDGDTQQALDKFIQADIRSKDSVDAAFSNYHPDLVVHTAGIVPSRLNRYSTKEEDWQRVKAVNYDGTINVLRATMASGCERFVYTSSVTAIIDDLDHDYLNMNEATPTGLATLHYGKSKGMAEAFVMSPSHAQAGLKACALRPCTIIGPDDTEVISLIYDLIAKGETHFIIGDGHNIYDWMYIDNAVHAHILAIENVLTGPQTAVGETFFITNQEPAYFWDFLAYVWAQFGHVPSFRVHVPVALAFFVALILEVVTWVTGTPATLHRGSIKDAIRTHYADNRKAMMVLGYTPIVGLSEGVRRSCDGYKRQLAAMASKKGKK
ncbi:hypothetical protein Q7P37_002551 [Cladosporium fusiforme]